MAPTKATERFLEVLDQWDGMDEEVRRLGFERMSGRASRVFRRSAGEVPALWEWPGGGRGAWQIIRRTVQTLSA